MGRRVADEGKGVVLGVGRKVGSRNGSRGCCATINTPRDATRHVFLSPPFSSSSPSHRLSTRSSFSLACSFFFSLYYSLLPCLFLPFSTGCSRFHSPLGSILQPPSALPVPYYQSSSSSSFFATPFLSYSRLFSLSRFSTSFSIVFSPCLSARLSFALFSS